MSQKAIFFSKNRRLPRKAKAPVLVNLLRRKSMISSATQELLSQFGLTIDANKVQIIDFEEAASCRIHHSRMPIALTAYTIASPEFSRGRFPDTTFIDLIAKRPVMDRNELLAFATVCGDQTILPSSRSPEAFTEHLLYVIDQYGLNALFELLDVVAR